MPDRVAQLTSSPEWQALEQHRLQMQSVSMKRLFTEDPDRASRYFIMGAGISLDFSKNRITDETLSALLALAERCDLPARRNALLRGELVNRTEQRPALHTALRHPGNASIMVAGVDVVAEVSADFGDFRHRSVVSTRMFPRQHMTFHGDEGFFTLTAPFNAGVYGQAQIEIHQPELAVRTERFPAARQYTLQVENFCNSVRTGAPYPCPLEFSRGTQAMIDMVFAAGGG